ncbi:SAM-dependent methyltransferase [Corallococcus sp. H22C18031201]|uniref:class I SAM-dependent methyltransferase n=1 Tax=Citreicoccus inhibens TaxID=2849499 RepID=UPI000E76B827|nr:class I SAM-dependent methyltransferase [Citreicoccus inhibens]MBU8895350.1 class I SAM-dependent methyltransferase [Citreicoccus inhibens]RJS22606.1 SAM-dependent methyltransferase [Corallococcus sp. H22C18031201]
MAEQPPDAATYWNTRFSGDAYAYGTQPNDFLAEMAARLPAQARVLSLAEGEGRNAVHLASLGHDVTAVDASNVGLDKAKKLAAARGVTVHTVVSDLADFTIAPSTWDAGILIFCHLPPALRRATHQALARGLKPGGLILLEAYTPAQLTFRTGGPPVRELLYTAEELREDFAGLELPVLREITRDVREGRLHTGTAAVVQLVARKPA